MVSADLKDSGEAVVGGKEQYRVDLSELDKVVQRIKRLDGAMDKPVGKVGYGTSLSKSALGKDFLEAPDLVNAHDEMQTYMDEVLKKMQALIRDFGQKTERARGSYDDAEHENSAKSGGMK
ncbi:hypothetical protein [Streptomyces gobiensis]|uniref:hypothetical protein n=1 Tax=Streptomyces gobiensis TaxID=2875706 RepID=UPI001E503FC3|nr:hypothetical protein [Streptomyces gobiensis]UGY93908.1 hypothetical protein test1122_20760 [Streptomyces gobiensis]